MAISVRKTKELKNKKPAMRFEDRDLMDALNAGKRGSKRNFTYRQGKSIIPVIEPLIIEKKPKAEVKKPAASKNKLSFEEINEISRDYAKEHMDPELAKEQKEKAKKLTTGKFVQTALTIAVVLFTGAFVMMLLFPQTELSELSRDNSNLKDKINTVKRQILDAEENANGITDMDAVRAQALQLGMQDPNQNQVVNLPIPNNDSLKTVVPYDSYGVNDDVLRVNEDALEEYYASHPGR